MSVQTSNKIEHPALLSQHSHSPPEFVTGFFPPQRKSMSRSETIRPYSLEPGLSSSTELKPTLRHGLVFPAPFTLGVKNKHTTNIMNPALVRDNLRDPCTAAEYRFLETSPRCDVCVCVCVCVCVWALAQSGVRQALGRGNENNKLLLRSHVSHARRREDAWYVNRSTILHSLFLVHTVFHPPCTCSLRKSAGACWGRCPGQACGRGRGRERHAGVAQPHQARWMGRVTLQCKARTEGAEA